MFIWDTWHGQNLKGKQDSGGWRRGNGDLMFNGNGVSDLWDEKNSRNAADCTMWMNLILLHCTLRKVKMASFMLCVFYHILSFFFSFVSSIIKNKPYIQSLLTITITKLLVCRNYDRSPPLFQKTKRLFLLFFHHFAYTEDPSHFYIFVTCYLWALG